jgi:hypothetical protein
MTLAATPTAAAVADDGPDPDRAAALLEAVGAAADLLERNRDAIDRLNVYPAHDGDTGTNRTLTMRAAVEAGRAATVARATQAELAVAMTRGALLGAMGNSGVILSQWLRGLAGEGGGGDAASLARAMGGGGALAYKAVANPVEVNMLSVIRSAADGCRASALAAGRSAMPWRRRSPRCGGAAADTIAAGVAAPGRGRRRGRPGHRHPP